MLQIFTSNKLFLLKLSNQQLGMNEEGKERKVEKIKLTEIELKEYEEIDHFFKGERFKKEKRKFPSLRSKL
jgi:hypothetical protein